MCVQYILVHIVCQIATHQPPKCVAQFSARNDSTLSLSVSAMRCHYIIHSSLGHIGSDDFCLEIQLPQTTKFLIRHNFGGLCCIIFLLLLILCVLLFHSTYSQPPPPTPFIILRTHLPVLVYTVHTRRVSCCVYLCRYRNIFSARLEMVLPIQPPLSPKLGDRLPITLPRCRPPVRAVSMTRLDQLAQPTRRHGEHIRAVIERQKAFNASPDSMSSSVCSSTLFNSHPSTPNNAKPKPAPPTQRRRARSMSRSLTHLVPTTTTTTTHTSRHNNHTATKSTSSGTTTTTSATSISTTNNQQRHSAAGRKSSTPLFGRPLVRTSAASKSMSTLGAAPLVVSTPVSSSSSTARLARAYANAKSKMRIGLGSPDETTLIADAGSAGVCCAVEFLLLLCSFCDTSSHTRTHVLLSLSIPNHNPIHHRLLGLLHMCTMSRSFVVWLWKCPKNGGGPSTNNLQAARKSFCLCLWVLRSSNQQKLLNWELFYVSCKDLFLIIVLCT